MTYVMSDIHGDLIGFQAMLEKINFSENDVLYILGDVIDRGLEGIAILQQIMATPNMVLLLGNHEHMMIDYLYYGNCEYGKSVWAFNGGMPTHWEYKKLSVEEKDKMKEFLLGLPDALTILVADQEFHLVHGCPADNLHDRIWGRIDPKQGYPAFSKTVIVGHTPVQNYGMSEILQMGNVIDIDCGNGFPKGRLACLRLEDMTDFYIYKEGDEMDERYEKGMRFHVSGDSAELWLSGYNVRVDTDGRIERTPKKTDKKVLVTLDSIDHDDNVCISIRKDKLRIF